MSKFDLTKLPAEKQNASALGNAVKSRGFVSLKDNTGRVYEHKDREALWNSLMNRADTKFGSLGMTVKLSF